MGLRGPRPKPTTLKLLQGTKPSRVNQDEPRPETGKPECPDDASPEVRKIWDYTLKQLIAMDIATPADRDALRCFCEAVVTHRKASKLLAQSPILVRGISGTLIRNPALVIQRDSALIIRQFAHEFGFTPSARSEIHAGAARSSATGADRYLTG